MRIIGPPTAKFDAVLTNVKATATSLFVDSLFDPLWVWAEHYSIDPVGIVAQSMKETGGGRYTGRVKPTYYNTCGLKVRHVGKHPGIDDGDLPLAHAQFPSWDIGALAHVQHVCAYAHWMPKQLPIVDPRYTLVSSAAAENWADLSGRWAPSPTYGQEIEQMMGRLKGA